MRARPLALLLLLSTSALAAPAVAPAKKAEAPLPKPAPRDGDAPDGKVRAKLPPFLGLFGPAALLQKTGFRSAPGRWIEFALEGPKSETSGGAMRLQEVGPAIAGARWIEVLATSGGTDSSGLRMLARGDKDGNLERMIASMPNFPAMEFPLDSIDLSAAKDDQPAAGPVSVTEFATGVPRKLGRETVTVPLGKFDCDHWLVEAEAGQMEFWISSDPKVPFNGAVKLSSPDGVATATKVGTDAASKIPVPQKTR